MGHSFLFYAFALSMALYAAVGHAVSADAQTTGYREVQTGESIDGRGPLTNQEELDAFYRGVQRGESVYGRGPVPNQEELDALAASRQSRANNLYVASGVVGGVGLISLGAGLAAALTYEAEYCSVPGACGGPYAAVFAAFGGLVLVGHALGLLIPAIILDVMAGSSHDGGEDQEGGEDTAVSLTFAAGPSHIGFGLLGAF